MKTRAPELRALMSILGSAGPVISTRRSSKSAGAGATVQAASRISRVAARKSGRAPDSSSTWRSFAALQELEPQRAEAALEVGDERERVVGQDPVGARDRFAPELDAGRQIVASTSALAAADGRLDQAVRLGGRGEDLAVVLEPERRQVDQPVVEVGQDHPDLARSPRDARGSPGP